MSDLLDDPSPGQNLPEFTVSEVSGKVRKTLEDAFGRIRVKGEVGRVVKARSGHIYFDVKDDRNVLACTTWKGQVANLAVMPEEGLEVVVTGKLTAYGAQSKYNMNVDDLSVAGEGALLAMLEKRKKALEAEGLFDPSRKKPLPYLPELIGVVTSPSGAVIRDILHRLRDRFPRKVLIWPVAVQGQNCAAEVARALEGFNGRLGGKRPPRPDVIIVARGGGSIEDLWGFNEEIVARAVAASDVPVISAVGHETDTTLIDFVSDLRAPTPTAAAEMAVPVRMELIAATDNYGARATQAVTMGIDRRAQRLRDLTRALPSPDSLLQTPRHQLDQLSDKLPLALERGLTSRRQRLTETAAGLRPRTVHDGLTRKTADFDNLSGRLARAADTQLTRWQDRLSAVDRMRETLSYKATLQRGYAVVRDGDGTVLTSADTAKSAGTLNIEFADGTATRGAH